MVIYATLCNVAQEVRATTEVVKTARCRQVLDIFRPWHPVCSGHGVPMRSNGRGWQCRVKYRERERERKRRASGPEYRERERKRGRDYYHRADGGWLKQRKRELAAQRVGVLQRMEELDESLS